ncbi:BON domain-containing protein [Granulosicoccus antarcticus]|uniref:BON domain-containing protein n=1 Tax=Granulosicoccus antarcticus IMCC3135 TaxID=1192854 RepID=A0A2Z2NUJ4_9GAMM|nr:BON domain-containing protein [Granulosicoccus antarcticus]ASJ73701.1 hypothetical protein IMCC3135_18110 [Granulosicoccus antarcticus IMCC3135]
MKVITASTVLLLSLMFNVVNAEDALIEEPAPIEQAVKMDSHISWQDFQDRLISYPRVNVTMSDEGVITLQGFVKGPFENGELEELANRVENATKVVNSIGMK